MPQSPQSETSQSQPTSSSDRSESRYRGVVAAAITPCSEPGVVAPAAMQALCDRLVSNGCNGIFVCGSSGESTMLDERARRQITAAAAEGAGEGGTVYVGVTGLGIEQTIANAAQARDDGAHAAIVMPPYLLHYSQTEILDYLTRVADQSALPVAVYNHPRMATNLEIDTLAKFAEHPNCVAIKETSTDASRMPGLVKSVAGEASVLQGNESLLEESLAAGANGMVTALAGVVPEWHQALQLASILAESQRAAEIQKQLTHLWNMFRWNEVRQTISTFTAALKIALHYRGWLDSTASVMPGYAVAETFRERVVQHLAASQVPTDPPTNERIDAPHALPLESTAKMHTPKSPRIDASTSS